MAGTETVAIKDTRTGVVYPRCRPLVRRGDVWAYLPEGYGRVPVEAAELLSGEVPADGADVSGDIAEGAEEQPADDAARRNGQDGGKAKGRVHRGKQQRGQAEDDQ